MKKYPINKIVVDVEALGGEIELRELTQRYRVMCNQDKSHDTPTNALINAGLTEEQVGELGQNIVPALYELVIDLTYPNARQELEKMIKAGTFVEPTEEEQEESKKNS